MNPSEKFNTFLQNDYNQVLTKSIIGEDFIRVFEENLMSCIEVRFASSIKDIFMIEVSVGLVLGLELENGQQLLVKILKKETGLNQILKINELQDHLYKHKFPCPKPYDFIDVIGDGYVVYQDYVVTGVYKDSHEAKYRKLQAHYLAQLHKLLKGFDLNDLFDKVLPANQLWQPPHNNAIDFEATGAGAEWIEEKALEAKHIIDSHECKQFIISHMDWSNKHFRFDGEDVSIIYDWDSLVRIDELYSLGIACSTFTATWYLDVKLLATPEEALAFVFEYCESNGKQFTRVELDVIAAYAAHTIAYTARCLHAIGSDLLDKGGVKEAVFKIHQGKYF